MSLFQPRQQILPGFLVFFAATSNAQTSEPTVDSFMAKASVECAAIKKKAFERHDIRVGLLKAEGKSDEIPAAEKLRDERIERLCALTFQTAKDVQAIAADKQAIAADKQAIANYEEIGDIFRKLEKNPSSRADLDRLPILYAKAAALATEDEKKNALPVIANVMRKHGLKVPGD